MGLCEIQQQLQRGMRACRARGRTETKRRRLRHGRLPLIVAHLVGGGAQVVGAHNHAAAALQQRGIRGERVASR